MPSAPGRAGVRPRERAADPSPGVADERTLLLGWLNVQRTLAHDKCDGVAARKFGVGTRALRRRPDPALDPAAHARGGRAARGSDGPPPRAAGRGDGLLLRPVHRRVASVLARHAVATRRAARGTTACPLGELCHITRRIDTLDPPFRTLVDRPASGTASGRGDARLTCDRRTPIDFCRAPVASRVGPVSALLSSDDQRRPARLADLEHWWHPPSVMHPRVAIGLLRVTGRQSRTAGRFITSEMSVHAFH